MSRTVMVMLVGALAAVALSGCEVLVPLWIASEAGSGGGGSYYGGDYYDYEYTTTLEVEVEELAGNVEGQPITLPMDAIETEGSQYGGSANFALTAASVEDPGGDRPTTGDDLYVVLDVCPIDEYAGGGPIMDPSTSFLNLLVCRADNCLDGWDSELQVDVVDDGTGRRRVTAGSRWPDGSEISLALRYTVPEGSGATDRSGVEP